MPPGLAAVASPVELPPEGKPPRAEQPVLVCTACRGPSSRGFAWQALEASRHCPACGRDWPALDLGFSQPVLFVGPEAESCARGAGLTASLLAELELGRAPESCYEELALLAPWTTAHWGRRSHPPLPGPRLAWVSRALAALEPLPAGPLLVLGAAVGGEIPLLARPGRQVVALEARPQLIAWAGRAAARPGPVLPWRQTALRLRVSPLTLRPAERRALAGALWICGNALDPPFVAESFAAILCLNLLDSVADPWVLLGQCEALLRPGGSLLLSSPYHWDGTVTPPEGQIERFLPAGLDLAAAMELLPGGRAVPGFLEEMEAVAAWDGVPWPLQVHERLRAEYRLHVQAWRRRVRAASEPRVAIDEEGP
jgi:SAM-dependent methyltransferase